MRLVSSVAFLCTGSLHRVVPTCKSIEVSTAWSFEIRVVVILTICFNMRKFISLCSVMCRLRFAEHIAIIFVNLFSLLVFVIETCYFL